MWALSVIAPIYGIDRLLSFARHRSSTEPNDVGVALIVVLTFGLAYLTWRFVERPFRQNDMVPKRLVWRFSSVPLRLIVCAVGLQVTTAESHSRLNHDADVLSGCIRAYLIRDRPLKRLYRIIVTRCSRRLFGQMEDALNLRRSTSCLETALRRVYTQVLYVYSGECHQSAHWNFLSGNTQCKWRAVCRFL